MSKESYARGFCKAASSAGVDPNELAKFAQSVIGNVQPPEVSKGLGGIGMAAIRAAAAKAKRPPAAGRSVWQRLKNFVSAPGPRQLAFGDALRNVPGSAPRARDSIYGGYGDARSYEDGYLAFQDQQ